MVLRRKVGRIQGHIHLFISGEYLGFMDGLG
jgi:hypothetical protein